MKSGASCGQAGDPAGSTSTSCGPLATGQRRVWDSSSPGWARLRWPAIVCGGDSRSCGARSCSIPSHPSMCCSGPARRATRRASRSCGPTCSAGRPLQARHPWRAILPHDYERSTASLGDVGIARRRRRACDVGRGTYPVRPHPFLPPLDLAGPAAGLSLYPNLLRLRPGSAPAPRRTQGELVGHPSYRQVPSMASRWRRSGTLTR